MSAEVPPDPILTTYQYWNWLNIDAETRRQRALDNTYMKFPTVQNNPTSFSKMFVNLISIITHIANTSYVFDKINDLLFYANTWTGLNTFDSIDTGSITTNTITATTLALSGTQLDTPMTSTRTYPVIPMVSTTGTVAYGTAGTIGYTLVNSNTYGSYFNGTSSTIIETNQSLSIPTGVWYLVGEVICSNTFGQLNGLSFGPTVPSGSGNPLTTYPTGFFGGDFIVFFSTAAQNNNTLPLGGGGMTISAVYTNATASPITVRLYFFRPGWGWLGGNKRGYFTATKIA
jgi:hypothetical protein